MSKSRKRSANCVSPIREYETQERQYCNGKLCLSKAEAHSRINGTKRRQHHYSSKRIPVRAYLCPDCGCYHLTSLPKYDTY